MSSNVLELAEQATREMGLAVPTSLVGNSNLDATQILGLLNACGKELVSDFQWQAITIEYRFTTAYYSYTGSTTDAAVTVSSMSSISNLSTDFMVTGTGINQDTYVSDSTGSSVILTQAASETATGSTLTFSQTKYSLPSDYDRQIDRTNWDKTSHWELLGPKDAQQWQWLKSGWIATGPRVRYRILGNKFQIWPPLGANRYFGFEYVSNFWVTATGGTSTSKTSFTVDTDTCIFPDRVMVLFLKKKYFEVKGFDATAFTKDFNRELDSAKAADAGSATLNMAPRVNQYLIGWDNIPDSGYGP